MSAKNCGEKYSSINRGMHFLQYWLHQPIFTWWHNYRNKITMQLQRVIMSISLHVVNEAATQRSQNTRQTYSNYTSRQLPDHSQRSGRSYAGFQGLCHWTPLKVIWLAALAWLDGIWLYLSNGEKTRKLPRVIHFSGRI